MSLLAAGTIGVLVAIGVLQILQRDTIRMVIGYYILWNAANLLLISVASIRGVRAPLTRIGDGPMVDPLVQALVLTAIVITFGFTAFLVGLLLWLARQRDSIDILDFQEGRG